MMLKFREAAGEVVLGGTPREQRPSALGWREVKREHLSRELQTTGGCPARDSGRGVANAYLVVVAKSTTRWILGIVGC
jgi:hypothetical protein